MTSFQIQCFLNVAQYLNFTEAANHLFVAQSSLSRNISNLEDELGLKLFIRTKKYVRLTPGGAVLYKEFARLMRETEDAIEQAKNVEIGQTGLLRLGVVETQRSENFLPDVLARLREKHPLINVDIQSDNFKGLREKILNHQIDIALTMHFHLLDFPQDKIVAQPFRSTDTVVAIPKDHRLAHAKSVHLGDLADLPLIAVSPDVSLGAYNNLMKLFNNADSSPDKIIYARSIQDMLLRIESGLGYTVLDSNSTSSLNHAVANLELLDEHEPMILMAVWMKENLNPIVPLFLSFLPEFDDSTVPK